MKKTLCLLLCISATQVFSSESQDTIRLIETAAKAQGKDYIEARSVILALGSNAIPSLVSAAQDTSLTWQERLVARICCERMERGSELDTLRGTDWKSFPPYQPQPQARLVIRTLPDGKQVSELQPPAARIRPVGSGPSDEMRPFVLPKCLDSALWYYFVELTWKQTGECSLTEFDKKFDNKWAYWCRAVLKDQPEEWYLRSGIIERIKNDATLEDRQNVQFYRDFLRNKYADAVPVLIEQYDTYNRREVTGPELFAGRHVELYRGMFEPILSFADVRHVVLLEKFISERPALVPLKDRLAGVRSRPAPKSVPEPPFRLGTNLVVALTKPDTSPKAPVEMTKTNAAIPSPPPSTVLPPSQVDTTTFPRASKSYLVLTVGLCVLAGCLVAVFLFVRSR